MERWQQIDLLFQEALQHPPAQRAAYLREVCTGDSELYRQVASLVANHPDDKSGEPWAAAAAARLVGGSAPLQPGQRLGPYEITSFVAAGGMGEVYPARDTRLDRLVAVKRLKAPHSDRFRSEGRAIAALNHPHICQVYDVGPDYLVMEYLDGETLADRLARAKDRLLAANEALAIAIQVADAVNAAHQRGILHRDLKPGNIMLVRAGGPSDPLVAKLLDFGLAKPLTTDGDVTRTVEGTVLGTTAYMSPEQAEGKPVDARSDVFSFGSVLYEMLAGHRPFEGATTAQVLSAVLRDDPRPLRTALPPLDRIVHRCLAKDPGQRFQTMAEVKAGLEQVGREQASAGPAEPRPSIAVLPFTNMSADKENEYFSDGLSEEIINALAHIPGVKVTARTSAFAFRGKEQDIRKIAESLGVRTILEGSVRRFGNKLRVTAQLINAEDGYHLWSERYDREMADVFAIQDDIAQAIAVALRVTLAAGHATWRRHTPNLPAYEAYLKARYYQWKMMLESAERSKQYYEQALKLDPEFASAHVGVAHYFLALACFNAMPADQAMPRVRDAAQRALEIDPSLPEAHAMLGIVAGVYDYNWTEAERRFQVAMAQDPVPPDVRLWYGTFYLVPIGRARDAIEEHRRVLREDPFNLTFNNGLTESLGADERWAECEATARLMLEIDPSYFVAHMFLTFSFIARWMFAEAIAWAEKAHALVPKLGLAQVLAIVFARSGDASQRDRLLESLRPGEADSIAYAVGQVFQLCGNMEQAADWMQRAIAHRQQPMAARFFGSRIWKSNPRWPALARMMNLPDATAS